jgi:glycosyltransferase involved in cell wall biosynthesis
MRTEKNVLLLIPDLGIGGAERAISRLSIALDKEYNVYLCRFTDQDKVIYPTGGRLLTLNEPRKRSIWGKLRSTYNRLKKLKKLKKDYKIDVSISFLEGANFLNVLSKQDEKTVISLRGSIMDDKDIQGTLGFIRKKVLIPWFYQKADEIIALSEGLKQELQTYFNVAGGKINVIYNHYDTVELEKLTHRKVPDEYKDLFSLPVITMSGRLHQQKGHREFLKVFKELRSEISCRLVIFGDGVLRDDCVLLAKRLQLKTYDVWSGQALTPDFDVYFMGYVKNPFHYIAASSVFVFPSLYEGLGNALVEALACKVLIIAADCRSGPREVLAPNTTSDYRIGRAELAEYGVLMPVINSRSAEIEWIAMSKKALATPALSERYAHKSIQRLQDFSADIILPKWREVIEATD